MEKVNKSKIILSIGIPAFNEEANIKKLLERLIGQEEIGFKINKIFVISDHSTDHTVSEVKSVKDKRIVLIENNKRLGQSESQNKILNLFPQKDNAILFMESDTLPCDNRYIARLVSSIPKNRKFSIIAANYIPIDSTNHFGHIVNYGFWLRHEIFENASYENNIYISRIALFSRQFAKSFRWDTRFHDDTYCHRMALHSGLPIVRRSDAKIYYKGVENFHDYLIQSSKFQKSRTIEKEESDVYKAKINYLKAFKISIKYFINNPLLFVLYFAILLTSRVYSRFTKPYTPFWEIYSSTKKLNENSMSLNKNNESGIIFSKCVAGLRYYYHFLFSNFHHLGSWVIFGSGITIQNAKYISLGNKVYLEKNVTLKFLEEFIKDNPNIPSLVIEDEAYIGTGTIIGAAKFIQIKKKALIGPYCYIGDHDHEYRNINIPINDQGYTNIEKIIIGEGVWVSANSTIGSGVTIGKNSVIGANSVVLNDIPPFSLAVGQPAKVVKQYNPKTKIWELVSCKRKGSS